LKILLLALLWCRIAFAVDGLVFIVNADNPVTSVSKQEIKDLFYKRKGQWPNGATVRFIDKTDSPERKLFLAKILEKTGEDVDTYWIAQKLSSGNSAPIQASSDRMVL
jgi:ABC-type phosphate transport system substrate-binding protein